VELAALKLDDTGLLHAGPRRQLACDHAQRFSIRPYPSAGEGLLRAKALSSENADRAASALSMHNENMIRSRQ